MPNKLIRAQGYFVPSEFLESLNHHDLARVSLGEHVAKRMSVLFCDLRGFTPLAERLDPRTVIGLLNQFFSSMERPIAKSGGFIDSFACDEIKVLFDQASTDAAVQAAVGMWRALDALNEHLRATDQPARRAAKLATAPLLEAAMQAYFGRDFPGALVLLQAIIERDPEDLVPPLFAERCRRYLAEPPSADWQGFEKLTRK